jgi:hypothetical protein
VLCSALLCFFKGLEGLIGAPDPKLRAAMTHEHTERADADVPFTSPNYLVESCSRVEFAFVLDGAAALPDLGLDSFPAERSDLLPAERRRRPRPLSDFGPAIARVNGRLGAQGEPPTTPPSHPPTHTEHPSAHDDHAKG